MMTAAAVTATTAMAAAGMTFAMVMVVTVVIALDVGIVYKLTGDQGIYGFVCVAGNTAEQTDAGCCQCHLGTAADTAADQNIRVQGSQNTCQSAVAAAAGIHDLGAEDLALLHIIHLKLAGMAEMLENFAILIGNCNSHNRFSFRFFILVVKFPQEALAAAAGGIFTAAEPIVAATDHQGPAVYDGIRQLSPG